ncbi:alcohol dehydrogenase catalytic domain-containing protein [Pseudonocardia eucalypti]|uniref:Alcohol dehydrogenase catalytic domain-containing protein n=2 Tax=Pseudonocardia eucalypti TaxID=648755 RepID=A0ABP9PCS6_9PSEU
MAAVVRPLAVATCDLDRAMMLGRTPFPLPLHLGHECVGEVLEVGELVGSVRVGQRVVVPFQISCGECAACRRGNQGSCTSVPPASMYGFGLAGGLWGGALADRLAVPFADAMLVPLPDGLDPAAAAGVADNVSDAYRQVAPHLPALLAHDPDAEVLIVGRLTRDDPLTSSTPLYAGLVARALGARRISVVDGRAEVRRLAGELGLRALDPRRPKEWPTAPLTVDATGTPAGLRRVLRHTAPDGVCTCVWSLHRRGGLPLAACYVRNVTLHIGRSHVRALIPGVLALMADGRLRPELVTTNVAGFADAPDALREHRLDCAVKTVLVA